MNRLIGFVALGVMGVVVLQAAGPVLVGLMHAVVPVVLAVGVVVVLVRLVIWFTGRW